MTLTKTILTADDCAHLRTERAKLPETVNNDVPVALAIGTCINALTPALDTIDSLTAALAEQIAIASDLRNEVERVRADYATRVACEVTNARADERKAWQEATHCSTPDEVYKAIAKDVTAHKRLTARIASLEARAVGVPDAEALTDAVDAAWLTYLGPGVQPWSLGKRPNRIEAMRRALASLAVLASLPASPPVVGVDPGRLEALAERLDDIVRDTANDAGDLHESGEHDGHVKAYAMQAVAARVDPVADDLRALIASAPPPPVEGIAADVRVAMDRPAIVSMRHMFETWGEDSRAALATIDRLLAAIDGKDAP